MLSKTLDVKKLQLVKLKACGRLKKKVMQSLFVYSCQNKMKRKSLELAKEMESERNLDLKLICFKAWM